MIARRPLLLMDANVLIDFCDADVTVIPLVSKHIGQVHVPRPILDDEVEQSGELDWTELEIIAVEPSLAVVSEAAANPRAGLSFHDTLCLLLARDNGWTCVTNDARLRRECVTERVPTLWGFELLALLVEGVVLILRPLSSSASASRAARAG